MEKTAVVILNWNTRDYLRQFLPPLLHSLPENARLIVADNDSTDGSKELVRNEFPDIELLSLDRNYGFTGGYNRAFDILKGHFERYLLINSDIEVADGWFEPLDNWMDTHPECGACGPKLHSWYEKDRFEYAGAAGGYIDKFGYPFCRGRVLKRTENDNGQYDSSVPLMWVSGACMIVRAELWHRLGGLDGRFFAHMEEIDLCWRMQLAGYTINTVPESIVWHIGGGTLSNDSPHKLYLNYRNNLLLLENNLYHTLLLNSCSHKSLDTNADNTKSNSRHGKTYPDADNTESASCVDGAYHSTDCPESKSGHKLSSEERHASSQAKRIIRTRRFLDILSAIVYLLQGKKDCFKAVIDAHKDANKLSGQRQTPAAVSEHASVHGIYPHWMLPEAIFLKKNASSFKTI